MKSVDEEDSEDDDGAGKMGLNLQDVNDIATPKDHEQNEQSFRDNTAAQKKEDTKPQADAEEAKKEKPATTAPTANVKNEDEADDDDEYSQD